MSLPKLLSVPVPGSSSIDGEGIPRVHFLTIERAYRVAQFGNKTYWDLLLQGKAISGNKPFLGHRRIDEDGNAKEFIWETYDECFKRVNKIANALVSIGLSPKENVGIFVKNCVEFQLSEFAIFRQSGCVVPIYDTLVANSTVLEHMLNLTEIRIMFAKSVSVSALLKSKENCPSLSYIICYDHAPEEMVTEALAQGVKIINFSDLEASGSEDESAAVLPTPQDLAYICFTSGTTGMPKGAMLLHSMLSSGYDRVQLIKEHGLDYVVSADDVHLSYLPKAHVFETHLLVSLVAVGARIGFSQGNVLKLMEDICELKPTILASTPRVYNRIYDKVMSQLSQASSLKKSVFHAALTGKKFWLNQFNSVKHSVWDKAVFASIKNTLGGRIRCLYTGAAPITKEVAEFLKIAFSCPVIEGYGQTESTAATTLTCELDSEALGTVGAPVPGCIVKLVDVPDMGYLSSNNPPAGEICFKGPSAFPGYYKAPEKTAETIDADGWVHTGDIGIWDERGRLKIVDRKKNLFKLAQGEYVSPEKIENAYSRHELIEMIFVHGDSTQAHVVAVIAPEKPALEQLLKSLEISFEDAFEKDILSNKKVRDAVLKELNDWIRAEGDLKGFEIVKNVALTNVNFALCGLLTPTFKLKRHEAKKHYENVISEMYSE